MALESGILACNKPEKLCTSDLAMTETAKTPDRYVTFVNIDFEGNMATVLGHLRRYISNPATSNAFWERFEQRLARIESDAGGITDKLLLLHSHVYYMVELFEDHDDEQALKDLKTLEEQCF